MEFTADAIIALSTQGGMAAFGWWILVKHLPRIEDRHREERQDFIRYMEKRDERTERITSEFRAIAEKYGDEIGDIRRDLSELRNSIGSRSKV